jgi:hypothetical protein
LQTDQLIRVMTLATEGSVSVRNTTVIAAMLVWAGAAATNATAQIPAIKLFIGAPTRGEFVDTTKDVQDAIKDLRGRLNSVKGVTIVSDSHEADLILTVVARGVGSEPYGQVLSYQEFYKGRRADQCSNLT